jgi:hypothetical protein
MKVHCKEVVEHIPTVFFEKFACEGKEVIGEK